MQAFFDVAATACEEYALFGELENLLAGEFAALYGGGLFVLRGEEFAFGFAGGYLSAFEYELEFGLAGAFAFHFAADGGEVVDDAVELFVQSDDFFVEAVIFLHDVGGAEFLEAGGVFLVVAGASARTFTLRSCFSTSSRTSCDWAGSGRFFQGLRRASLRCLKREMPAASSKISRRSWELDSRRAATRPVR